VLNLTSQYEAGGSYVSGTVYSNRTFDHGYFEARMKWPKGTGFDSSFWLYPEGRSTPAPEIDIIEAYPNDPYIWPGPNMYQATMHYVSGGVSRSHQITYDAGHDLTDQWHTVGAEWIPGKRITYYFDGINIGSMTADVLPSTQMNAMFSQILATWSAPPDETTPETATMQVDWVRWWDARP
jgi:beta-glucanase (GH16 family)